MLDLPTPNVDRSTIAVVTVTYGERKAWLEEMLVATLAQGVGRVVVVNNGSPWNVTAFAARLDAARIAVVDLPANQGSAPGYVKGLEAAIQAGAEYIWLIDDDNLPGRHCLDALLAAYSELGRDHDAGKLAVSAYRLDQHEAAIPRRGTRLVAFGPSSFLDGFHLFTLHRELWRQSSWQRSRRRRMLPALLTAKVTPYSGLFFHRSLIEHFGLPRSDFVLYADDTEFTYRITANGGQIYVVPAAVFDDLVPTWNMGRSSRRFDPPILTAGDDLRAYYATRNLTYFFTYCNRNSRGIYWLNRHVYMMLLFVIALARRRRSRYRVLRQAMDDGLARRMGVSQEFPL